MTKYKHVYKRLFAFLIFFIFFYASLLKAEKIPLWLAKEVAQNYVSHCVALRGTWAGTKNPVITGFEPVIYNNELLGYNFKVYPKGHLLVPYYDEFSPVLIYSETSGFNPEKANEPGSIESWIIPELYNSLNVVDQRKNNPAQRSAYSNSRVAMAWDRFSDNNIFSSLRSSTAAASVGPLLETYWDQGSPYNLYCPANGMCSNTKVGCVALAWAQVMNYWEWPDMGTGSHSYYWLTGQRTLNASFNNTYDWNSMPERLTALSPVNEKNAVAQLCYDVAIASETEFGCSESSSLLWADNIFQLYFKYKNTANWLSRCDFNGNNCYSAEDWFDFIKTELDTVPPRPVIFSIFIADGNGGHETVIDGYEEGITDKVHINFGWDGNYNGYYDITNNFLASYLWDNSSQVIVVGIEPDFLQASIDTDKDAVLDINDNCPLICNSEQLDADGDGIGDVCDDTSGCGGCGQPACEVSCDIDNDGIRNAEDNCPDNCNTQQLDADTDGIGDVCDPEPRCGGCGQDTCELEC